MKKKVSWRAWRKEHRSVLARDCFFTSRRRHTRWNCGWSSDVCSSDLSHLVYGYETFSPRVMKTIGKGATPETNERSLRWTMAAGVRPIPNQIIGFPDEDFDSLRDNVTAWNRLGLQVKPFFATPYPGTEWYYKYKPRILEQYYGDLEAFLLDVGDATRITANICRKFSAVELYGLRELMVHRDQRRLDRYEAEGNRLHR